MSDVTVCLNVEILYLSKIYFSLFGRGLEYMKQQPLGSTACTQVTQAAPPTTPTTRLWIQPSLPGCTTTTSLTLRCSSTVFWMSWGREVTARDMTVLIWILILDNSFGTCRCVHTRLPTRMLCWGGKTFKTRSLSFTWYNYTFSN